jgi:hypothetical protein
MFHFDTKEIDAIAATIAGARLGRAATKERALARLKLLCEQKGLPEELIGTARTAQDAKRRIAGFQTTPALNGTPAGASAARWRRSHAQGRKLPTADGPSRGVVAHGARLSVAR